MPNFFARPANPTSSPVVEPAGYGGLRAAMMRRFFQQTLNPYGLSGNGPAPRAGGQIPYNPRGGMNTGRRIAQGGQGGPPGQGQGGGGGGSQTGGGQGGPAAHVMGHVMGWPEQGQQGGGGGGSQNGGGSMVNADQLGGGGSGQPNGAWDLPPYGPGFPQKPGGAGNGLADSSAKSPGLPQTASSGPSVPPHEAAGGSGGGGNYLQPWSQQGQNGGGGGSNPMPGYIMPGMNAPESNNQNGGGNQGGGAPKPLAPPGPAQQGGNGSGPGGGGDTQRDPWGNSYDGGAGNRFRPMHMPRRPPAIGKNPGVNPGQLRGMAQNGQRTANRTAQGYGDQMYDGGQGAPGVAGNPFTPPPGYGMGTNFGGGTGWGEGGNMPHGGYQAQAMQSAQARSAAAGGGSGSGFGAAAPPPGPVATGGAQPMGAQQNNLDGSVKFDGGQGMPPQEYDGRPDAVAALKHHSGLLSKVLPALLMGKMQDAQAQGQQMPQRPSAPPSAAPRPGGMPNMFGR